MPTNSGSPGDELPDEIVQRFIDEEPENTDRRAAMQRFVEYAAELGKDYSELDAAELAEFMHEAPEGVKKWRFEKRYRPEVRKFLAQEARAGRVRREVAVAVVDPLELWDEQHPIRVWVKRRPGDGRHLRPLARYCAIKDEDPAELEAEQGRPRDLDGRQSDRELDRILEMTFGAKRNSTRDAARRLIRQFLRITRGRA